MKIIVTHRNADFDALAAQVAAAKLYPGTVTVTAGPPSRVVRDFLALHKDLFELTPVEAVDLEAVTQMIIVDVRRKGRLRTFAPVLGRHEEGNGTVDIHVFDHHPPAADDVSGHFALVEPVGSTTTLLVERLLTKNIGINPIEATLYALGIHSDTGSLTLQTTTPRDVRVAAVLLERGASLSTLRFFLRPPLTATQRESMINLVQATESIDIDGVHLGIGMVPIPKKASGLSGIVDEVLSFGRYEALFALFHRGERITLIGRSRVEYVDIGNIMQQFDGGGHPGAGSAYINGIGAGEVRRRLLDHLRHEPPRPRLVRDLMSTPVRVLAPADTIEESDRWFRTWNISGAPVLKEGELVGILSKRNIRTAREANRTHLPVSSFMAHDVVTVTPEATLIHALQLMMKYDIGRLPVIEGDHVTGIITRTDVLKVIYPTESEPN